MLAKEIVTTVQDDVEFGEREPQIEMRTVEERIVVSFALSIRLDQLRLAVVDVPYAWLSLGGVVVMVGDGEKEKRRATMQGQKITDKTFFGLDSKGSENCGNPQEAEKN